MDHYYFTAGTAIVTGAAGGIGEQVAYALAGCGSALALTARAAAPVSATVSTPSHTPTRTSA